MSKQTSASAVTGTISVVADNPTQFKHLVLHEPMHIPGIGNIGSTVTTGTALVKQTQVSSIELVEGGLVKLTIGKNNVFIPLTNLKYIM